QVLHQRTAVFHAFQGVFDGQWQAQVAALIATALYRRAGRDAFDHTDVAAQQAGGNGQVRVGVGARQAVLDPAALRAGIRHTQADGTVFFAPLHVHRRRGVGQEAAERVDVGGEQRQRLGDELLQATDVVQEQLAHAAVFIAEDVLAGGHVDHALVQVHGT